MKTIRSTYLSSLLLAGAVNGLGGEPFRTDINPALQYYQAFIVAPDLPQSDRDYLFTNQWRGQRLPERFGELVARYEDQFKLVRQAAHATVPCDWGIDMSPGPASLLPHLSRNKRIAQTAQLRAQWHLQQGRQAEAAQDLLAALALGRNCSRDGTLISALVQIAVENIICSAVAENFHRFSPEAVKELAAGLEAAPARGTMAACISSEKAFFHDWLVARILRLQKENPGNDASVTAEIQELFVGLEAPGESQPDRWEQITKTAGGTSDGVVKLLRDEERFYQRLEVIMALPSADFAQESKRFSEEIRQSSNPLVTMTFPAFEKAREKEFTIQVELAMLRAALEYRLHGEPGLRSVVDPCGQGPFAFRRFLFEGVDRGFELKSTYTGRGFEEVLIFVENDGPAFYVNGQFAGKAVSR